MNAWALYAIPAGLAVACVALTWGLCRAAARRPVDFDAELEALIDAVRCDCPRCTARRHRTEPTT